MSAELKLLGRPAPAAERCRFEQVVPADGHQAAADEGHVRGRVERQQLAQRVDQEYSVSPRRLRRWSASRSSCPAPQ
jgi:hypothetical protein